MNTNYDTVIYVPLCSRSVDLEDDFDSVMLSALYFSKIEQKLMEVIHDNLQSNLLRGFIGEQYNLYEPIKFLTILLLLYY